MIIISIFGVRMRAYSQDLRDKVIEIFKSENYTRREISILLLKFNKKVQILNHLYLIH